MVLNRVVGGVVNIALIYASILYAVAIGCIVPAMRTGGSGGFRWIDPVLWSTALALPASVILAWTRAGTLCTASVAVCWLVLPVIALVLWRESTRRERRRVSGDRVSIGFFHPSCDQAGGGERVLWSIVHHIATLPALSNVHFYIYTQRPTPVRIVSADAETVQYSGGSTDTAHVDILRKVRLTFGFDLLGQASTRERLHFVWLDTTACLDSARYSRLTLILQSLGSVIPGVEALTRFPPHAMIDTCGYPFIYPVFSFIGDATTMCYTHYPVISKNMLQRVSGFALKLYYYRLFAQYYALMGKCVSTVMVNSKWTNDQLTSVWGMRTGLATVYPPCMVNEVSTLSLTPRQPFILSVAQFRPEKRHDFQLEVFARVLELYGAGGAFAQTLKLVLVGTLRERDRPKKQQLEALAATLHIADRVIFATDVDNATLRTEFLGKALVGIHTMRDEHFGIGVVELMASGVITAAHRSGGPELDIVVPAAAAAASSDAKANDTDADAAATGYLCDTRDEYAQSIVNVLRTYERQPNALQNMQHNARRHVQRFSEESFRSTLDLVLVPRLVDVKSN